MEKYDIRALYQTIVERSYDAIMVSDENGRILIANQATLECMELDKSQVVGKLPAELVQMGIYTNSTILQALKTKKMVTGLVNVRGKSRLSTSIPLFDQNGEVEFVVTNNRSDVIMDEFARQLAYEKQQHDRYHGIANYLLSGKGGDIIYQSSQMKSIVSNCATIASADSSVIIIGESGVGKELIAKLLHNLSARKDQAFIPVNCAAIPPELFESELFGYRPGAFTGANNKGKMGLVRMAHEGTLFLDEVGELPLLMQSKLLRFIESGEIYPVGSSKAEQVDVRILSATNRNLFQMVKEKRFREDLYYRLNVIPIFVPPLRERPEDIEAITNFFLEKFNKRYGRKVLLSEEDIKLLSGYSWPGNVRELRNVIERTVLMSETKQANMVSQAMFQPELLGCNNTQEVHQDTFPTITDLNYSLEQAVALFEQQYIETVVQQNNGQLQEAAKQLGIHRCTLYRKLKQKKDTHC